MSKMSLWIVGAPRSGTTLTRNLMNLHPQIALCRFESHFVPMLLKRHYELGRTDAPQAVIDQAVRIVCGSRLHADGVSAGIEVPRKKLREDLSRGSWPLILMTLLENWSDGGGGRTVVWGDKTPLYVESIDEIYTALEKRALFLHVVRDPRAQAASERATFGKAYRSSAMAWRRRLELATNSQASRDGAVLQVRYEDLVADPTSTLAPVINALGLDPFDWDGSVPESDALGTSKGLAQVGASATEVRLSGLSPRAIRAVERICGEVASSIGYDVSTVGASTPVWPTRAILRLVGRARLVSYIFRTSGARAGLSKLRATARERS